MNILKKFLTIYSVTLIMVLSGQQLIEILVKDIIPILKNNGEIFHFVDQFSNCPALANQCAERRA